MIEKIERKLKTATELLIFKIKNRKKRLDLKTNIYKKPFLDAIKNEIEEQKKR